MEGGRREGSRKILWNKEGGKGLRRYYGRRKVQGSRKILWKEERGEGSRKILWKEEGGKGCLPGSC